MEQSSYRNAPHKRHPEGDNEVARRDLRARNKAGEAVCNNVAPNFSKRKVTFPHEKVGLKLVTHRENGFVAVFEIPRRALLRSSG